MPSGFMKHITELALWPTLPQTSHCWLWNLATRKVCCSTLRTMRFVSSIFMKVEISRDTSAASAPSCEG